MGEAQRAGREVINLALEQKGSWKGGGGQNEARFEERWELGERSNAFFCP